MHRKEDVTDETLKLSLDEECETICRSDVKGIMFVTVGHDGKVTYFDLMLAWFNSLWVSSILMYWFSSPRDTAEKMKELKRDGLVDKQSPNYPVWTIQEVWERLSLLLNSPNEEGRVIKWCNTLSDSSRIHKVIFVEAIREKHSGKTCNDPKRYIAGIRLGLLKVYEEYEL